MTFPTQDEDGFSLQDAAARINVSRETLKRISIYIALLDDWRTRINLIGPNEGRHLWRRHVFDSLQLVPEIGASEKAIVDLGSGAGFPGIILACAMADRPDVKVTLVEKSVRKAEFLAAAIKATGSRAVVLNQRIEDAPPKGPGGRFDLLTARALKPLPVLLDIAEGWLKPDGRVLLLKGREVSSELTLAQQSWRYDPMTRSSWSHPDGTVLALSNLRRA
jgi:16S rRNA (guanine527-N7)-methyltransferase